jgi:hypothetical protein
MNTLHTIFQSIGYLFRWWFLVLPWEQGVRVRFGKSVRVFASGLHFMVPFVDRVYVQNTRLRISPVPAQTLTTKDNKTVTLCGSLRYRIESILTLYQTLHQAEETLGQQAVGLVAEYVANNNLTECAPAKLAAAVSEKLNLSRFGLNETSFLITDFAVVHTYRFISDGVGHSRYVSTPLDTNVPASAGGFPGPR